LSVTQERPSIFVFSIVLIAVTAYWVWFPFSHGVVHAVIKKDIFAGGET
jgi:hypothetical protein